MSLCGKYSYHACSKITREMLAYILLDKAYFYDLHIQTITACVTRLLSHLSRVIRDDTEQMSHGPGFGIDRKRWRELMEKRIAMGHKPDDHEEQSQGYQGFSI